MCCFLIWLDEDDADIVEDEDVDVDTWLLALLVVWPIIFFISAIEFCISPSPCLMAAAELVELELELDCFEDAVREEDMRRCVEDVLAIRDVVVLLVEDTLLLELLLLLLRSSCAVEVVIAAAAVEAVPAEVLLLASDDEDDAFDEPNRPRVGGVDGPIIVPPGLPVSGASSDISRRGNRN